MIFKISKKFKPFILSFNLNLLQSIIIYDISFVSVFILIVYIYLMINKKYLKNLRCKEINKKNDFIFDLYNERIIDSLDIINLNFKNILILGNHGSKIIYI